MFNRANALEEIKASLVGFQGGLQSFSISLTDQKQLLVDFPDLPVEEAEGLLIIQAFMSQKQNKKISNASSSNSENQHITPRQQYISNIVTPLRSQLNELQAEEIKSKFSTAEGDQAFAIQIALAKLFPFNHEETPGKWFNPITLDEIDGDTPDIIIMSNAPAISLAEARAYYKNNNAFDNAGNPKDYRGYRLSTREMQSLIDQNVFPEKPSPINFSELLYKSQPSPLRRKIINGFSRFGELCGMAVGMVFVGVNFYVSFLVLSQISFMGLVLLAPAFMTLVIESHQYDIPITQMIYRDVKSIILGMVGATLSLSLILPLGLLITSGLASAAIISSATVIGITNSTFLWASTAAAILSLMRGFSANPATTRFGEAAFNSFYVIPCALPKYIGKVIGEGFGTLFGYLAPNIMPSRPRYIPEHMTKCFKNYQEKSQPQQVRSPSSDVASEPNNTSHNLSTIFSPDFELRVISRRSNDLFFNPPLVSYITSQPGSADLNSSALHSYSRFFRPSAAISSYLLQNDPSPENDLRYIN